MTSPSKATEGAGDVRFFRTSAELRDWFEKNHETAIELWVGFYKTGSGRPSVTWPEVVDEALCVGWIDGIRKGIDDISYKNRLTPRRKGSTWSAKNIARVHELEAAGRMKAPGRRAFEARDEANSGIYSYERAAGTFEDEAEAVFRADAEAWDWFQTAAPSYRRAAIHWVGSAKQAQTRARRLKTLIDSSAAGRTVPPLTSPTRPRKAS